MSQPGDDVGRAGQQSLKLPAKGFGTVTAANFGDYLVKTYLEPSATVYVAGLSAAARTSYLKGNRFITGADGKATFTGKDVLAHVGARKKDAPAFDAFDLSAGENNQFGNDTTQARHFTPYSLRRSDGGSAQLDADLPDKRELMNPMYHLANRNSGRAKLWWIRVGTKDSDTSLTVVCNLALALQNLGDDVDARRYWDAGHGADEDPEAFIAWIAQIAGYAG